MTEEQVKVEPPKWDISPFQVPCQIWLEHLEMERKRQEWLLQRMSIPQWMFDQMERRPS